MKTETVVAKFYSKGAENIRVKAVAGVFACSTDKGMCDHVSAVAAFLAGTGKMPHAKMYPATMKFAKTEEVREKIAQALIAIDATVKGSIPAGSVLKAAPVVAPAAPLPVAAPSAPVAQVAVSAPASVIPTMGRWLDVEPGELEALAAAHAAAKAAKEAKEAAQAAAHAKTAAAAPVKAAPAPVSRFGLIELD